MAKLQGWRVGLVVFILFAATAIAAPAQTFNTLVKFDRANGANPLDGLAQGTDGNFYGTTLWGGADRIGTAFKIRPAGALTTLNSFTANPRAGLVLATDGNFYGSTFRGGANVYGEVFKITPQGTLTTLYNFCSQTNCTDGSGPYAALVQATDGNFYGTTAFGGNPNGACADGGCGTIFKVTPAGAVTTLHSFDGTDGNVPTAGLLQATNGDLYGTTYYGGATGRGAVFRITLAGTFTTLRNFHGLDGAFPYAGLIQDSAGNLYGTTYYGGANRCDYSGCGTVFKISPAGTLTTLYSFCARTNCTDGKFPFGGLVQATDGNFYGTTYQGGSNACNGGCGTIFRITPAGAMTTLHSFDGNDGNYPYGGLLQATNGTFYGTNSGNGNVYSLGTVYSLAVGLHPFVSFVRGTAKVGRWVEILGQGFVGTTSVSFNGTLAAFKVKSDTYLAATVPQGATTGFVTVKTPGGTLQSNVVFRVTP
jgi:uncharacterized repeat protein (TIGR03803 family)